MTPDGARGSAELRAALRANVPLFGFAFLCGTFVNLLMLTGPLYMLQVYDRVIGSRSQETLVALSLLVCFLFLVMGVLDHVRGRMMAIAGARFQIALDRRVFAAAMAQRSAHPRDPAAITAERDIEAIRMILAAPVLLALSDLPWTPLFITAIFAFHAWLGWLAIAGGAFLVAVAALNQCATMRPQSEAAIAALRAERLSDQLKAEAEAVRALGMTATGSGRWLAARHIALNQSITAAARTSLFAATSKAFRLLLQSALLGLGAWLVIRGELSAGAMMAASVLMGRGLAPVEVTVGQWHTLQRAWSGWARLSGLLGRTPAPVPQMPLLRPEARLQVTDLTVAPPGAGIATLHNLSFNIAPGQALGVIGPSGSGKSTLAQALTGVWTPSAGSMRLGGAALDQYGADVIGRYIGYVPQSVALFDGTIAENIARLQTCPDPATVVAAARKAGAHDMILRLPGGYDTRITQAGGCLSGGQVQRIGLARALYGDPLILILDEPDSNLDGDGSLALSFAIRAMKKEGKAVLVMAHRSAAIRDCDHLLVIDSGHRRAFGPRERVLSDLAGNTTPILKSTGSPEAA
jgi:ATP-binding cassette, subfamily C, bacterial